MRRRRGRFIADRFHGEGRTLAGGSANRTRGTGSPFRVDSATGRTPAGGLLPLCFWGGGRRPAPGGCRDRWRRRVRGTGGGRRHPIGRPVAPRGRPEGVGGSGPMGESGVQRAEPPHEVVLIREDRGKRRKEGSEATGQRVMAPLSQPRGIGGSAVDRVARRPHRMYSCGRRQYLGGGPRSAPLGALASALGKVSEAQGVSVGCMCRGAGPVARREGRGGAEGLGARATGSPAADGPIGVSV